MRYLAALALWAFPAFSYSHYSGYCQQGGQKVLTSSVQSVTSVQQSYPQATLTVYLPGTSTKAVLVTSTGSGVNNPLTCSTKGYFDFYSAESVVDLTFSGVGISAPFTWEGIVGSPAGFTLDSLYTALSNACSAAGTGTLLITKIWAATPTQSFPCKMQFMGGGQIAWSTNATLTWSAGAAITAPATQQIFDMTAPGAAISLPSAQNVSFPWFGTSAAAINQANSSGSKLVTGVAGTFPLAGSTVNVPTGVSFITDLASTTFTSTGTATCAFTLGNMVQGQKVALYVKKTAINWPTDTTSCGIKIYDSTKATLNIRADNFWKGTWVKPVSADITDMVFERWQGFDNMIAAHIEDSGASGASNQNTVLASEFRINGDPVRCPTGQAPHTAPPVAGTYYIYHQGGNMWTWINPNLQNECPQYSAYLAAGAAANTFINPRLENAYAGSFAGATSFTIAAGSNSNSIYSPYLGSGNWLSNEVNDLGCSLLLGPAGNRLCKIGSDGGVFLNYTTSSGLTQLTFREGYLTMRDGLRLGSAPPCFPGTASGDICAQGKLTLSGDALIGGKASVGGIMAIGGAISHTLDNVCNDSGAANAAVCAANSGPAGAALPSEVSGLVVTVALTHTLRAGSNTFAYNGGSALPIKKHTDPSADIGVAYSAASPVMLWRSGAGIWLDMGQ